MVFNLDLTLSPRALRTEAPLDAAFLNGTFTMETKNGQALLDGELAEYDDPVANALLESAASHTEITVTSSKSSVNTTNIAIELGMADGVEIDIGIALTMEEAPAFVPLPSDITTALSEEYVVLYEELLAVAVECGKWGEYDYLTKDGHTVTFEYYYGESTSFTVTTEDTRTRYSYHILMENGEYVVKEPIM